MPPFQGAKKNRELVHARSTFILLAVCMRIPRLRIAYPSRDVNLPGVPFDTLEGQTYTQPGR